MATTTENSISVPILKLNNGVEMPALGFGTFANELVEGKTYAAVIAALDAGYRHLDCAWYYLNEDEIGSALRDWLGRNQDVKRKDIFITTKVWPHLSEPEDVEWSLDNSLQMLGTDYVDAFLIHWPFAVERTEDRKVKLGSDGKYTIKKSLTDDLSPTWRAMEKMYKAGKARSIGVSNWKISGLETMLKYAEIKPAINQVEIHPFLPNNELMNYCISHDILPVAYSPLGSQHQVETTVEKVTTNRELIAIAEKKEITLAQLLIAWGLKRGYAVLPKSETPSRIKSNFQLVELNEEEFGSVNKVAEGRHCRFVNPRDMFGYDVWPEEGAV
ncbi:probable reductase [Phialocephala subalpina]|jgi:diketogulonate reductase-like aldo/keto reductase|uniref:Probable reductase n=1 Tax=Phialocephala subalpina TaxID=576137 RepID=A0A1L7WWM6_9HELO|nr:probable reductase [Phialocephala subalpina]